jgi:hypothetical protein
VEVTLFLLEGRLTGGELMEASFSFLMKSGLQKSEKLRLMYQAKLLSFHIKVV